MASVAPGKLNACLLKMMAIMRSDTVPERFLHNDHADSIRPDLAVLANGGRYMYSDSSNENKVCATARSAAYMS